MKQLRLLGLTLLLSISFEIGMRAVEDALRFNHLLEPTSESEGGLALFVSILLATSLLDCALASIRNIATAVATGALASSPANWQSLNLLLIETVRSLSAIIVRLPLLLLPALAEWYRLLSIPFVVLFDQSYRSGNIDALKASRRFTREHYKLVLLASLAMAVPTVFDWILEAMTGLSQIDSLPIWTAPAQHIGSCVFFGALKFAVDAFLIWIYRRRFVEIAT
ncbi:MAG: hypothetical protein IPM97_08615 [Bdellovibrionaceae bacterium]|nr:hypothetical protein [Pseudobdellovibrionaceae bacterium]